MHYVRKEVKKQQDANKRNGKPIKLLLRWKREGWKNRENGFKFEFAAIVVVIGKILCKNIVKLEVKCSKTNGD